MKENELRVGNLIYDVNAVDDNGELMEPGGIITVDPELFFRVNRYPDNYLGIRLTTEWIKKLGINNDPPFGEMLLPFLEHLDGYNIRFLNGLGKNPENISAFCSNTNDEFKKEYIIYIDFVHTLQNLYFALKGEELTLKP